MGHESTLDQARRHVERGRIIIKRQREIIERLRSYGADSSDAEDLLQQFERSLASFEDDLSRFIDEKA